MWKYSMNGVNMVLVEEYEIICVFDMLLLHCIYKNVKHSHNVKKM